MNDTPRTTSQLERENNQLRAELELARKCVEALRVAKSILELDFDYRPDDNVSWDQCKEAIAAYDQFKASQ